MQPGNCPMSSWLFIFLLLAQSCHSSFPAAPRKRARTSSNENLIPKFLELHLPETIHSPKTVTFIDSQPSTPVIKIKPEQKVKIKCSGYYKLPDAVIKIIASFLELPWSGWTRCDIYSYNIIFSQFKPLEELSAKFGWPISQTLKNSEMLWLSENRIPGDEKETVDLTFTLTLEKQLNGLEMPFLDWIFPQLQANTALREEMAQSVHPFNKISAATCLLNLLWKHAEFERILMFWDWFGLNFLPASLAEVHNFGIVEFICKHKPVESIFVYFSRFEVREMFFIVVEASRILWSLPLIDEFLIRSNAPTSCWLHFVDVPGELLIVFEAIKADQPVKTGLIAFERAIVERFEGQLITVQNRDIFRFVRAMLLLRSGAVVVDFSALPLNDGNYIFPLQFLILTALQADNRKAFLFLVKQFIANFKNEYFSSTELRQALMSRAEFIQLMLQDEMILAALPALFANNFHWDALKNKELFFAVVGINDAEQLYARPDLSHCLIDFSVFHSADEHEFMKFLKKMNWPVESFAWLFFTILEFRPALLTALQQVLIAKEIDILGHLSPLNIDFEQLKLILKFAPRLPFLLKFKFLRIKDALEAADRMDEFDLELLRTIQWPAPFLIMLLPHQLMIRRFVKEVLNGDLPEALKSSFNLLEGLLEDEKSVKAFARKFKSILKYLRETDLDSYFLITPFEALVEDLCRRNV